MVGNLASRSQTFRHMNIYIYIYTSCNVRYMYASETRLSSFLMFDLPKVSFEFIESSAKFDCLQSDLWPEIQRSHLVHPLFLSPFLLFFPLPFSSWLLQHQHHGVDVAKWALKVVQSLLTFPQKFSLWESHGHQSRFWTAMLVHWSEGKTLSGTSSL